MAEMNPKPAPGQVWMFNGVTVRAGEEVTLVKRRPGTNGWMTRGEIDVYEEDGTLPNMTFVRWADGYGPNALPVQPLPTNVSGAEILPLVHADLDARSERGVQKYGTTLRVHNGRSATQDAYEEALDLAMYLRQAMEREAELQAKYEALVAAVRKLPGGDERLGEDPVVIANEAAKQIQTLFDHAKANGRTFVANFGWKNWAQHVVMPGDRETAIGTEG